MNFSKRFFPLAVAFLLPLLSFAQIKLPALISDHMVLQQKSSVALWGWTTPNQKVQVLTGWDNRKHIVTSDLKGKFMVDVKTSKAGGPYTISFIGNDTTTVRDVMLGEVWLASGQSNMEFFMAKTSNASYTGTTTYNQAILHAEQPLIRYLDVPNLVSDTPVQNFKSSWLLCNRKNIDTFSAVAYFFAKEIHKVTGYPIGIINATWGGTPAESWTRKDILENDPDFVHIIKRYDQQLADYPADMQKYREALNKYRADTSKNKGSAPREPIGARSNKSPFKLYNGMINPLIPYTLKGVIWYQGENNADRAFQYRRLFPAMIDLWRNDFRDPAMPFYFVQISPHRSQNPEIRDAQFHVYRNTKHTGMVVTTDNGDSLDIHPRNKELVGKRLSLWALKNQYGQKQLDVSGPLYRSMKVEGNSIRIFFDHDKGLMSQDGALKEFLIAGEDQKFVPAKAFIENNTVIVLAESVQKPVAVRFAWRNVPDPNFYNASGLPASPFRTDNWTLTTQGKN